MFSKAVTMNSSQLGCRVGTQATDHRLSNQQRPGNADTTHTSAGLQKLKAQQVSSP